MCQKNSEKEPGIADLFRRVDFFCGLDEATINRFAEIATVQHFHNDETIMLAGDTRRAIFFITKGNARVFSDSKVSRNSILNLLGIGDFFGEIQLFNESGKCSISVQAEGECSVIFFKGNEFIREISNIPELSVAFLKDTAGKLNKAYKQIASLSMNTIKSRIISCLMQFVDETGVRASYNGNNVIKLKNRPTQQQLAGMSGTSRETVNRELATLIKDGYIELSGKDLILLKEFPFKD